jgi:WYL domain
MTKKLRGRCRIDSSSMNICNTPAQRRAGVTVGCVEYTAKQRTLYRADSLRSWGSIWICHQAARARTVLCEIFCSVDERRELVFSYWSTFDTTQPRRHRVAPYGLFFRPDGHSYLDATLLEVTPVGTEMLHAAIDYRLDRIVSGSVQVLPALLPRTGTIAGYCIHFKPKGQENAYSLALILGSLGVAVTAPR